MTDTSNITPQNDKNDTQGGAALLRVAAVLIHALGVFLAVCFITQNVGVVSAWITDLFLGLFSWGAYFIPLFLFMHGLFFVKDRQSGRDIRRTVFSCVMLLTISTLIGAFAHFDGEIAFAPADFYLNGQNGIGGGFFGELFAFLLTRMMPPTVLIVAALFLIVLYAVLFFAKEKRDWMRIGLVLLTAVASFFSVIEQGIKYLAARHRERKRARLQKQFEKNSADLFDDDFIESDNGLEQLTISRLNIEESRSPAAIEANPTLQPRVHPSAAHRARPIPEPSRDEIAEPTAPEKPRTRTFTPIVIDDYTPSVQEPTADEPSDRTVDADASDRADDIFTKNFDPLDLAMSAKRAVKPSSQVQRTEETGIGEFTDSLAEELAERERKQRNEAFERKKREALAAIKNAAAPTPSPAPTPTPAPAPVSVSIPPVAPSDEPNDAPKMSEEERKRSQIEEALARPVKVTETEVQKTVRYSEAAPEIAHMPSVPETFTHSVKKPIPTEAAPVAEPTTFDFSAKEATPVAEPTTFDFSAKEAAPVAEPTTFDFSATEVAPVAEPATFDFSAKEATPVAEATTFDFSAKEAAPVAEPTAHATSDRAGSIAMSDRPQTVEVCRITPTESDASMPTGGAMLVYENAVADDQVTPSESVLENDAPQADAPTFDKWETVTDVDDEDTTAPSADISDDPNVLKMERSLLSPTIVLEEEDVPLDAEDMIEEEEDEEDEEDAYDEAEDACEDEEPLEEDERTPIPPEEQNPQIEEYRKRFNIVLDTPASAPRNEPPTPDDEGASGVPWETDASEPIEQNEPIEESEDSDAEDKEDEPSANETVVNEKFEASKRLLEQQYAEKAQPKKEREPYIPPDYSNYQLPPIDFLIMGSDDCDENMNAEIQATGEKLIDTLDSFGVQASIRGFDCGPRITRYEVVPARGVKVSRVTSLFDDIALALAAEGIRMEAPIPGKSAIGFEIPNKNSKIVHLRELIDNSSFISSRSKTLASIGKDVSGMPVYYDIAKMPHALIAGATGMGKSVCMNAILLSILFKARPDEVKLIMIDPKRVEFKNYDGIPHLLVPVVTEPKQAAGALAWAVEEMNRRYELIGLLNVKKIDDYNVKVADDPSLGDPIPKIIIVIDELNDLMVQARKPVEDLIMLIAQKARAAGIHLLIGTQRPTVDVITGVIKANIPTRIACKVASNVDSRSILECAGAEKLLDRGDMLFVANGAPKPLRVQGAYVSDEELDKVIFFLKSQMEGQNTYDESILDEINRAASRCDSKHDSEESDGEDGEDRSATGVLNDQKFLDAVELSLHAGKISTSLLQRKLGLGYGKAAKYIDHMEELGVVSERNGQKPRDVLVTKQEWHDMLARRSLD